jgi:hypothetical protein
MELDDIEEEDPDELEKQMNMVEEERKEDEDNVKGGKQGGWD